MAKKPHPLDSEFDIAEFSDEFEGEIEIPDETEERNLDLVIEFALRQYKMNADDIGLMEPRVRLKTLEINRDLLNTVKDAFYKKEMLKLNREKLEKMGTKKPTKAPSGAGQEDSGESPGGGVTRKELAERAAKLKAVK